MGSLSPAVAPRLALVSSLVTCLAVACAAAPHPVRGPAVHVSSARESVSGRSAAAGMLGPRGYLAGVYAITENDVWSVGASSLNADLQRPLIEHWDGTEWRKRILSSPSGGHGTLTSVDGTSAGDVWTVGYTDNPQHPIIEHWSGRGWTSTATPPGAGHGVLSGVSAVDSRAVWAVGWSLSGDGDHGLILHWDGRRWSVMPNPADKFNGRLADIDAIAQDDVWAVGTRGSGVDHALVEHWDGSRWALVRATDSPAQLLAVNFVEANDGWLAGSLDGSDQALLEHWDGLQWSAESTAGDWSPVGLGASSGHDIWAVGSTMSSRYQSAAQHFDGSTWSQVPTPDPGGPHADDFLSAVAVLSPNSAWAVGEVEIDRSPGGPWPDSWILILRWDGSRWTRNS